MSANQREICGRCERPKAKPFSHVEPGECAVDVSQPLHGCDMKAERLACQGIYIEKLEARVLDTGCPCLMITPCHPQCSHAHPGLSAGCRYCAGCGSTSQRKMLAERIARALAFTHGVENCIQDSCENAPFGSVGGLDARAAMVAPKYAPPGFEADYLRGYQTQARALYGADWKTCAFGWAPALTVNDLQSEDGGSK